MDIWNLIYERKSFFIDLCLEHLMISAIAIVIAIAAGGLIGILLSEYPRFSRPVIGVVNFLYTIPSISMLGFLIPLSGIGNITAVLALIIYALLPMVRNTYTGITNVDPAMTEAAEGMGSTRLQILTKIKIPLAAPVIMSGIRSMVTMTLALAGIASFIGAGGLGVAIYRGITTNNTAMTVAGSILIALIALLADFLLGFIEKSMQKKHRRHRSRRTKYAAAAAVLAVILAVSSGIYYGRQKTDTIRIAAKPMTEQYILGEMLKIMIEEDTDLKVEMTQGVGGGTSNIWPAMKSGEFDVYPEYTGTAWNMVLKRNDLYTEDKFAELEKAYDSYDMEWDGMYGFSNSYALAVRKEVAEKYGLKKISDLQSVSGQLKFGAEYDFYEREDGYDPLCETYGLEFASTSDLDIGLKYQAVNSGEIDVMPIFTTDGQYSVSDIVVLEDDRQFYPSYECGNIVREEVLDEHPELRNVFEKCEDILDEKEMAKLNYMVEEDQKEPEDVAREFLKEKGLIS
ncbi:ABC transporter permease/substrate-binding protein [Anaerostipes sp.]|uniref:ABC transporter permease/substrate-binding protein n=1 Tax=Anaerostipes sp. TaxID=1872530 RepID=UPI00257C686C|nr:glycine betaine ABC transporter substrate-binding protein [Anaerostipes sp.]